MKHTKIIFYVCLFAILFFNFAIAEQIERTATLQQAQGGEQSRTAAIKEKSTEKTSGVSTTAKLVAESKNISEPSRSSELGSIGPERILAPMKSPSTANFILVTDVLDGFGGQKYDGGCRLSFFAGGQSSPIGEGSSTNYKLSAGFVYPAVVKCGDANGNGVIEVGDILYVINYLYKSGPVPDPYQSGEANCDGIVNIGDVLTLINYLYKGGSEPIC